LPAVQNLVMRERLKDLWVVRVKISGYQAYVKPHATVASVDSGIVHVYPSASPKGRDQIPYSLLATIVHDNDATALHELVVFGERKEINQRTEGIPEHGLTNLENHVSIWGGTIAKRRNQLSAVQVERAKNEERVGVVIGRISRVSYLNVRTGRRDIGMNIDRILQ
jgi:hypothetical protein